MTSNNRIVGALTEQDVTELQTAIEAMKSKLDFLITLTRQDRRELPKMGERSIGFEEKCATHMATNPEFLPGFVSLPAITSGRALRSQLQRCFAPLQALCTALEDTLMAVSSEIWLADLAFYHNAHDAARRKLPGAEAIYSDLSSRFPGARRKENSEAAAAVV